MFEPSLLDPAFLNPSISVHFQCLWVGDHFPRDYWRLPQTGLPASTIVSLQSVLHAATRALSPQNLDCVIPLFKSPYGLYCLKSNPVLVT